MSFHRRTVQYFTVVCTQTLHTEYANECNYILHGIYSFCEPVNPNGPEQCRACHASLSSGTTCPDCPEHALRRGYLHLQPADRLDGLLLTRARMRGGGRNCNCAFQLPSIRAKLLEMLSPNLVELSRYPFYMLLENIFVGSLIGPPKLNHSDVMFCNSR